jgi:hypothetical protein
MTGTVEDPVRAYRSALPAHLVAHVRDTTRLVAAVHTATRNGWTVDQLAAETTRDLHGVYNPGGLITHRLAWCAQHPPPPPSTRKAPQPRPWCGTCSDPYARWSLDPERPDERCHCWTSI